MLFWQTSPDEINRVKYEPGLIIDTLIDEIGLVFSENNFESIVRHAIHLPFTRDPFDRIIIAQGLNEDLAIVSSDKVIDEYGINRKWNK